MNLSLIEINSRNKALDGLRGFLCLYVSLFHLFANFNFVINKSWRVDQGLFGSFFDFFVLQAPLSLPVFFILSALTLFSLYEKRKTTEKHFLGAFYIRRIFRIMPLWWVFVFVVFFTKDFLELKHLFANLFFTFGFYLQKPIYNFTTIGWTLFVEECFYVVAPILFILSKNKWRVLLIFVLFWVIQYFSMQYCIDYGVALKQCQRAPFSHMHYFIYGILIVYFLIPALQENKLWGVGDRYHCHFIDTSCVLLSA